MKTGTTLLLLALAGGLLLGVFFWDSAPPGTRELAQRNAHVLHFDAEKIEEISIEGGGETIELQRDDGRWFMKEPVRDRAEEAFVMQILALAQGLRQEAVLTPGKGGDAFKPYGLDQPGLRLRLEGGGKPVELLFGKETPVEGRCYAKLEGRDEIYVVDVALRDWVGRKADDFREHRLSDLDPRHVSEVTIETAGGTIRLVRDGVDWELRQPLRTRANAEAVAHLLQNLLTAQIMAFAPAKGANLTAYGLTEPKATVTLRSESRDEPVRVELGGRIESGGEDVPAGVYVRLSTRRAVVGIIPEKIGSLATLTPDELRDRHLLRLEPDMVDRIALRSAARPPVMLERQGETWVMAGNPNPVNGARVEAMMAAVRETPVTAFVANVASDLARYGLDHPRLRVTFSSYASATTAESGAGELPIATVAFGAVEEGQVYAMVEDEPFIVTLPEAVLEKIDGEMTGLRALKVFHFPAQAVTALAVAYPEKPGAFRPPLSLKRSGEGWQMVVGSGRLDPVQVESLVNTLAGLTAMRWMPDEGEELREVEGLGFQLADGNSYELEIGKITQAGGGEVDAGRIRGGSGFFILSEPDARSLRLWLTEVLLPGETPAPPAASPTPASSSPAPAPAG